VIGAGAGAVIWAGNWVRAIGSGSYSSGWNDQVDLPVSGSEGKEEVVDHLMNDVVVSLGFEVEVGVGMILELEGCRNDVGGTEALGSRLRLGLVSGTGLE
jgi:hypothetical protein